MKQRMIVALFACAAMLASSPSAVRAQVSVSAGIEINSPTDFYQPLEPYGSWVDVPSYGRCWHPRETAADWQPYTTGHWEWTDAGWYWASDEPWGWACFHYGSWYNDSQYGWVWIPGTDWAPAWVTWRYSDDYIGWAPCGPGLSVLAPSFFTFCDVHRFEDHFHSRRDFVMNDTKIINRTKVVKDFQRQSIDFDGHQRTVFANRGPGIDPIRRATGRDVAARPVRDVIRETQQPENIRRDNNQPRDQRPTEQRRETPAPTGKDQPRNYQQPDNRGRQEQPVKPDVAKPTPDERPTERTLPPTGREDVRPAQPEHREATPAAREPQQIPKAAPEQRKEVPAPATPPDRPLPPTGREEVRPAHPDNPTPPVQAPAARPAPPVKEAPPAHAPDDGRGRDGRDRNNQ